MESRRIGLRKRKKRMGALKNKLSLCLFLSAEVGEKEGYEESLKYEAELAAVKCLGGGYWDR
jgi:hypothetical protein